jgi:hypothetical protein
MEMPSLLIIFFSCITGMINDYLIPFFSYANDQFLVDPLYNFICPNSIDVNNNVNYYKIDYIDKYKVNKYKDEDLNKFFFCWNDTIKNWTSIFLIKVVASISGFCIFNLIYEKFKKIFGINNNNPIIEKLEEIITYQNLIIDRQQKMINFIIKGDTL